MLPSRNEVHGEETDTTQRESARRETRVGVSSSRRRQPPSLQQESDGTLFQEIPLKSGGLIKNLLSHTTFNITSFRISTNSTQIPSSLILSYQESNFFSEFGLFLKTIWHDVQILGTRIKHAGQSYKGPLSQGQGHSERAGLWHEISTTATSLTALSPKVPSVPLLSD